MDSSTILLLFGIAAGFVIYVLWCRLHSPTRRIERLIKQLEAGELPAIFERTDWDFEITHDSKGFTVVPLSDLGGTPIYQNWASITEAIAFKRDLLCVDQVCIVFRSTDGYELEVHEEMKGWRELCEVLPNYLPGTPAWESWFMKITTPAFELNPTPLFRGVSDG